MKALCSEFPEDADRGKAGQPVVEAALEFGIALGTVRDVPVDTTHVLPVRDVGDFDEDAQRAAWYVEAPAHTEVDAGEVVEAEVVTRAGYDDVDGLAVGVETVLDE